jgi:hypothetical protein
MFPTTTYTGKNDVMYVDDDSPAFNIPASFSSKTQMRTVEDVSSTLISAVK